jgi:hypothetical protein
LHPLPRNRLRPANLAWVRGPCPPDVGSGRARHDCGAPGSSFSHCPAPGAKSRVLLPPPKESPSWVDNCFPIVVSRYWIYRIPTPKSPFGKRTNSCRMPSP